jgi:hypothetical protein
MGTETLKKHSPRDKGIAEWFNEFQEVLSGALVPRNSTGLPQDLIGNLGQSSYRWLNAYLETLKVGSGTNFTALQVAAAIAASYDMTLPTGLPAQPLPMKMSNAGVLSTELLQAADIANGVLTISKRAARPFGQVVGVGGIAVSPSVGVDHPNPELASCTIETTGRPVRLILQPDGSSNLCYMNAAGADALSFYRRASTDDPSAAIVVMKPPALGEPNTNGPYTKRYIDTTVPAGVWTYSLRGGYYLYSRLIAYEL